VARAYIEGQLEVKHAVELFEGAKEADKNTAPKDVARLRDAVTAMTDAIKDHKDNLMAMKDVLTRVDKVEDRGVDKHVHALFRLEKTYHAANMVLLHQRSCIEHLKHEGLLDGLDSEPMIADINSKIQTILHRDGAFRRLGRLAWGLVPEGVRRLLPQKKTASKQKKTARKQNKKEVGILQGSCALASSSSTTVDKESYQTVDGDNRQEMRQVSDLPAAGEVNQPTSKQGE